MVLVVVIKREGCSERVVVVMVDVQVEGCREG